MLTSMFVQTNFQPEVKKWATVQESMNRGITASQGRRIYRRGGLPRVFWRGQGGGGSLEQINGQTVPSTKIGMGRHVQKSVTPGLCYLTSLSSYLTILTLTTVNSNMFLTSDTTALSSNTQIYEISGISGKREMCESPAVRTASEICVGRCNHTCCHPQVAASLKTICSRPFTHLAVKARTANRLPYARCRSMWMLKVMPFKTDHLTQLHLPDRAQRTQHSGA